MNKIEQAIKHYTDRVGQRPGPIRAALIDMDGTLYDSMPWHARAWYRMVTELGIEADINEFFAYEGMTGSATINLIFERAFHRCATDDEVKQLYAKKSKYFVENNNATVMPGAQSMIREFRRQGIETVLVTGSGQTTLINMLDRDFDNAFKFRITSHDVTHGKPDPEPYLRAMELAGVEPHESIVVENAPLGIMAGVRSGAFTVGVTTGPIPRERMQSANPDILFDSMLGFDNLLRRLLYNINDFQKD